jgi:hypothetical protein
MHLRRPPLGYVLYSPVLQGAAGTFKDGGLMDEASE